jgi:hypothetical protein
MLKLKGEIKESKFTESQVTGILKQRETGNSVIYQQQKKPRLQARFQCF